MRQAAGCFRKLFPPILTAFFAQFGLVRQFEPGQNPVRFAVALSGWTMTDRAIVFVVTPMTAPSCAVTAKSVVTC